MNYYAVYDAKTGILLAEGNAVECRRKLKCSSLDTFYALVNRAKRGINKKYRVVIKKGGEVDYPVLGKDDPIYVVKRKRDNEADAERASDDEEKEDS